MVPDWSHDRTPSNKIPNNREAEMKTNRCLYSILSLLFSSLGIYLLLEAVRNPGRFPDECILAGATLTALGMATVLVVVEQQLQIRPLARHMKWNSQKRGSSMKARARSFEPAVGDSHKRIEARLRRG
jgi:hypothetical protein